MKLVAPIHLMFLYLYIQITYNVYVNRGQAIWR